MPQVYNKETEEYENRRELGIVVGPLATRFDSSTEDSGKTAPPTDLTNNQPIAHAFLFPIQGLRQLSYAALCQRLHPRSEINDLDCDILTPVGVTRVGNLVNTDRSVCAARIGGIIMLIAGPVRYDRDENIYTAASESDLTDNCGVAGF
ncbi:hypothetical protein PRZ48_010256 [Zasmidium cellare]|uniref:Uncharacterized protein n=1 Tax=Zasmidium cellare TaxID=395010 RepID=A0ABR0E8L6_ZASCE|nr:hypothetical protein PRZ48_010256 [Zasmidium cellare]